MFGRKKLKQEIYRLEKLLGKGYQEEIDFAIENNYVGKGSSLRAVARTYYKCSLLDQDVIATLREQFSERLYEAAMRVDD